MYLRYYGFKDYPFSVTPDPAFLYLSASHREALGHLLYGVGAHGGFVALTGEVGTGKTTLIRALVGNEKPDLDIALCWNPQLGVKEFVATICDELGADYDPHVDTSLKALVDRLNAHLLNTHAGNRRTVLIIDEAQNLSHEVLEQLRLLTNLETHKDKLLRIILVGQPELGDLLARHELRQLAQRVTARYRLEPLKLAETRAYVVHRLERAGGPQHLFSRSAIVLLQWLTGGVPRLINMVCERALMGGYAHSRSAIGASMVLRAAIETLPRRARSQWLRIALPTGALAITAVIVALAWLPDIPLTRAAGWMQIHDDNMAAAHSGAPDAGGSGSGSAGKASGGDEHADQADVELASASANPPDHGGAQKKKKKIVADNGKDSDTDAKAIFSSPGSADDKTQAGQKKSGKIPAGNADINQLLRLWGVFGSKVHISCASLHVGDLRCLDDRGSFSMLEHYNRPALLVLQRGDHRQTVLLSSITKNRATLVGGKGTRQVARAKLLSLWTGRFQMIWRANSGVGLIEPGTVGNSVVWLRRRLAQAQGKNPDIKLGPESPVYDGALKAQLKHFQLANGLKPDGMAGPRTQIMLNGAVPSPGSPELKKTKNEHD